MKYTTPAALDEARERAWSTPLDQLVVADPALFQTDTFWPYFERLRREAPVLSGGAYAFSRYPEQYDSCAAVRVTS